MILDSVGKNIFFSSTLLGSGTGGGGQRQTGEQKKRPTNLLLLNFMCIGASWKEVSVQRRGEI